jgi:hypothetical protein
MSSKPYDDLPWWCQLLDPWFGPPWYAEIEDFDVWLAEVRRHLAGRVDELTDELAWDDIPGEGHLDKAGRLTAARYRAEEIIRHEYSPLTSEGEDDGDEEEPTMAVERPVIVDREHPPWAEVDAEQQERIGTTDNREGV